MGNPHPNSIRAERRTVHLIDNLNYLLDGWGLSADDIARKLGDADSSALEKRLDRLGLTNTVLAEEYRKRKPGYCPECRLINYNHRQTCKEFIPERSATYRNKQRVSA